MMEYRFATASDIDALIKIRLEMLRIVNDLEDDYESAGTVLTDSFFN